MFQALHAHHQEANCIDAVSGIVLSVSGRSVHRLRENIKNEKYVSCLLKPQALIGGDRVTTV